MVQKRLHAGTQEDMLKLVASHHGRNGDLAAPLTTRELLFEETVGHPLTDGEVNALIVEQAVIDVQIILALQEFAGSYLFVYLSLRISCL